MVVERGLCSFSDKAIAAQQGRAVGIIIVNTESESKTPMLRLQASEEDGNKVKIPVYMASHQSLQFLLRAGAEVIARLVEEEVFKEYEATPG